MHAESLHWALRGSVGNWMLDSEKMFVYDKWNLLEEITKTYETGTLTAAASNYYVWGLDQTQTLTGTGGVGGLLFVADNGGTYLPTYDGNGNVSEYLNQSGAVVAHYEYSPFGAVTLEEGEKADKFNFRFSTKYADAETQLSYYGYRFYDANLGSWLSRDPIEEQGGLNLYGFVGNNVVNNWDLLGMDIYLVTGNPGKGSVQNNLHQKVCADLYVKKGKGCYCKQGRRCFSFGKSGYTARFGARLTWLGWSSYTLGGILMEGEIYEDGTVGTIGSKKKTTRTQDKNWLKWMDNNRVGLKDIYSLRHSCRKYAQMEYNDAP